MTTENESLIRALQEEIRNVRDQLAESNPDLMARLETAERMLQFHSIDQLKDWSWIADSGTAVDMVFLEDPGPKSKAQVIQRLVEQNYIISDEDRWTVNDILNYRVKKGQLVRVGAENRMDTVVRPPTRAERDKLAKSKVKKK